MIFNCQNLAESCLENLNPPKDISLGVVQIGEDEISAIYIKKKKEAATKIGIKFNYYNFSENISFDELKKEIENLTDQGLIVQLPIKGNLETQEVLNLVPYQKDIDMLSEVSLGKFFTSKADIIPPVVGAIDKILNQNKVSIKGKIIGLIGMGRLVGKPMMIYATQKKATVISISKETENVEKLISQADIIITGVGKHNIITPEMVKKNVIIIDAGTTKKEGKVVGDINAEKFSKKASFVTPVPGGVGPLTVVALLENLVKRNV